MDFTKIEIKYNNSYEYRSCLRKLFNMKTNKINAINQDEPLDKETQDELDYDLEATKVFLDFIYEKTKNNKLFRELYDKSAGKMFSTDREIGLTVLLSYDYLYLFHKCLVCFFETPEEFTRTFYGFIELNESL